MARMQKDGIVVVSARLDDEELLHVVQKGLPREYIHFYTFIRTRSDSNTLMKWMLWFLLRNNPSRTLLRSIKINSLWP